ncbi:helix-turn-helix transcriptional regulator [Streptomyces sp. AM 2-1-1]|uniref:helix-turn-helix domain-containing protein n=1 Tax=Streptomyces sp. AM 2-1-1 TaxID=3028709 RepID=UPI0023B8C370|nr:helix-turn-helix transcriptional regulator [Streptomyces sp. AM 2-1-1]WEH40516.1 helix-turn-helix transcriptional regulator [Streptomyces sp. AM 2-1-1]
MRAGAKGRNHGWARTRPETPLSATGNHFAGGAPGTPDAHKSEAAPLTLLGLDPLEDAVYRLLVDRPDSEPGTLAGELATPLAAVRDALDSLVVRGLASCASSAASVKGVSAPASSDSGGPRYRAASPALALGPLLEARRSSLHQVESLMATLAERHRSAQAHASGAPVEVLSGVVAIRRRLLSMQERATTEVCSLMPLRRQRFSVISFEDNHDEIEDELIRRGVALRAVIERDWLEDPRTSAAMSAYVAQGQQISVVDTLPIKLIVVDREIALLPLDPERDDTEPVALVVHRTGLLVALSSLFEAQFARGRLLGPSDAPADGADGTGPAQEDRRILALLHLGMTDSAIARHLGVGHRTVQRRLQKLMAQVGASTRFQLGWHAARNDWIDGPTTPPPEHPQEHGGS